MLSQHHPHRFSADFVDYAAPDCVLGQQPNRPTRPTVGWRPTHQSHDRSLLAAVELGLIAMIEPWLLAQCVLETARQVAMRDARNLATVRTERHRDRTQAHAPIQHQQGLHAPPDTVRPLFACATPTAQLATVCRRQLQPLVPTRCLHPPL